MAAKGERDINKLVTKVTQLVALASSPHEEEARSAAFLACQLIREHQLVIARPDAPESQTPPQTRTRPVDAEDMDPILITSRYEGWCKTCHQFYNVGEQVYWRKGKGCMHVRCAPRPTE